MSDLFPRVKPPIPVLLALVLTSAEDLSHARERARDLEHGARLVPPANLDEVDDLLRRLYPTKMGAEDRATVAAWVMSLNPRAAVVA